MHKRVILPRMAFACAYLASPEGCFSFLPLAATLTRRGACTDPDSTTLYVPDEYVYKLATQQPDVRKRTRAVWAGLVMYGCALLMDTFLNAYGNAHDTLSAPYLPVLHPHHFCSPLPKRCALSAGESRGQRVRVWTASITGVMCLQHLKLCYGC
jgi:hypothetical protein